MRCLVVVIAVLGMIIAVPIIGFVWYGWWGLLGGLGSVFVLLWLLTEIGPGASAKVFQQMYRQAAGAMRDATITVHGITLADEPDAVATVLRQLEGWIDEFNEESEGGFEVDLAEFLTHNEENLEHARYFIDITVTPPESEPDASWAPHAIGLSPIDSDDGGVCEVFAADEFDADSSEFREFLTTAFEEISGERRIRLHVGLDPSIQTYRFEYAFVNLLNATIDIPKYSAANTTMQRLTKAMIKQAMKHRPLKHLGLDYLPASDADIDTLASIAELESVSLEGTDISPKGILRLREAIPNLRVYD